MRKRTKRGPGRPGIHESDGADLLLRAAQSAFSRDGFSGASLRQIAATAGVDPALAAHHFGSKEALWVAVIDRLAETLRPYIAELCRLQDQKQLPVRDRIETALRRLVSVVCENPEGGLLLARIGTERGAKLDLMIEKISRPYHDAFLPLLKEAMNAKIIARQPVEMLYFMLINAVIMSAAFRHILGYFDGPYEDQRQFQRDMTKTVLATFFGGRSLTRLRL